MTAQTIEIWLTAFAIILLLLLSAFFNSAETSLTAVSRARMHALDQDGDKGARRVNRILGQPEKMLGTVLIGNTLVDVLAASLATSLAVQIFGDVGVAYATIFTTLMVVIFAAVLPKTFALAQSDRTALAIAPAMTIAIQIFKPVTFTVERIVTFLLKLTPGEDDDRSNILSAHAELRGAIDLHHREGSVVKGEKDMLGGILDLGALQVGDVMVHRTKFDSVSADASIETTIADALKSSHSRLPVWRDDPDNIVGVLHVKDLLRETARAGAELAKIDISKLWSEPWYVPDTTPLRVQLSAFLRRKAHMALVIDEYGEVMGLVTLEDILEEIVGEISDEHDRPDSSIRPQADGSVLVDGSVPIRDINRMMDWDLPDEEATTIAGLVIHEAQMIPESGQTFTFHDCRFEILRKNRNRIAAIKITPILTKKERDDDSG